MNVYYEHFPHTMSFSSQFTYPQQSLKVKWSNMLGSIDFANQLVLLHDMESARNNMSNYLSKWLVTVLGDRQTTVSTEEQFPLFTKKVRDEMLEGTFRRNSGWLAIKVLLQLRSSVESKLYGRFFYKSIMLRLLAKLCDTYNDSVYKVLNVDLINQLIAKLARRIEKLIRDADTLNAAGHSFCNDLYESVVAETKTIISKTRKKIDQQIKAFEKDDSHNARLSPIQKLNFEEDSLQKLPKLMKYIGERRIKFEQPKYDGRVNVKPFKRHKWRKKTKPGIEVFNSLNDEISTNLYLSDWENWFLYEADFEEYDGCSPTVVRADFFEYASKAQKFYKDDPIGSSKMLLVCLKKLVILDRTAVRAYPLLEQHRSGINPNIFNDLLLAQHADMEIAYELQNYFQKRNSDAHDPALIEESQPTRHSFSVKFAESNSEMQRVRQTIQQTAESEIEVKRSEWKRKRTEVEAKKSRAASMTCDYYTNHRKGFTAHDRYCKLCALRREIKNTNMSSYERPLPSDDHNQNAVVFELRIPIEIACLRDVLYQVAKLLNGTPESFHTTKKWIEYSRISAYNQSNCTHVTLISTSQLTLSYGCRENHVDYPFDSFILSNGYSCYYAASENRMPVRVMDQSAKRLCTLKVESQSPYENLQWTVNSTKHTQNAVLAKQRDCSLTLTLAEFKYFGSLRADGHRLQLRKLYQMMKTQALSFESPSVVALIMQTMYEAGPVGNCNFYRDSHEDFTDPTFAVETVEMLDEFIEQQRCNWKHPLKLVLVALISVRIFELNVDESVATRIVKLLLKLREIAVDWIAKIQTAIKELNKNNSNEMVLREKMVDVAIAGAITFFVHACHRFFEKIFLPTETKISSLRVWLECVVTLNNNYVLSNETRSESMEKRLIFMRMVRYIGVHVERGMQQMIECDPTEVFEFIKEQWQQADTENTSFGEYYFHENESQALIVPVRINNERNNVMIDLITGEFEVNNQPVAKLSLTIARTAPFKRCFEQFVFEVQSDKPNCFTTVQKYKDCSYRFRTLPNGNVIITERKSNGDLFELLPHELFEIPYLLAVNYSHWWNRKKNIIEFRPKVFSDERFSQESGVEYLLNLKDHRLVHVKTKSVMLDVNSESYNKITEQLSRLESKNFIHIFIDTSKSVQVELTRMHLKFEVVPSQPMYDIVSNEFDGMRVSMQQRNGTLFGLNHGLLLESIQGKNKLLLILPHGAVNVTKKANYHTSVSIKVDGELNNPPFHTYHFNDFCKQIISTNSNYSAWLYLAYLHAVTSHGVPEPFTELTGW